MSVTGGPTGSNIRSYSNSTPDLTDIDFGPPGGMLNKSPDKPEIKRLILRSWLTD